MHENGNLFPTFGHSVFHMTTRPTANEAKQKLADALAQDGRSVLWLSTKSGIKYRRLLAELNPESTRVLSLETTCAVADALNLELPDLIGAA